MPRICEYTVKLDEEAVSFDDCFVPMRQLVQLYRARGFSQSDDGKYQTVILESPFGSALLCSNDGHDVPRINLSYRDGAVCTFPTYKNRCILPLAMMLVLGGNEFATLNVQFHGEMPSDEVMIAAAELARQTCPGLTCPAWFPEVLFGSANVELIYVPDHLDFRT